MQRCNRIHVQMWIKCDIFFKPGSHLLNVAFKRLQSNVFQTCVDFEAFDDKFFWQIKFKMTIWSDRINLKRNHVRCLKKQKDWKATFELTAHWICTRSSHPLRPSLWKLQGQQEEVSCRPDVGLNIFLQMKVSINKFNLIKSQLNKSFLFLNSQSR